MGTKWIFVVAVLIISVSWAESKSATKPIKKASSAKPTKTPKSLVEEFTELPPEDVEFIKQLDKQFQNYGKDIKIQVVKENSTSKNSKRTIDGELGYGFGDHHSNGFYFSKPKFMIYPYSQHDIPASAPAVNQRPAIVGYGPPQKQQLHTTVEIQPSQSFELKHTGSGYESYSHNGQSLEHPGAYQHQQQYPQEQSVPVIVLRIPGPQKYAAHLQALLQQYLEIRAAQYLRAIQEQELHGHGYQQVVEQPQYQHPVHYQQPEYRQPEPQQYYQPQYQVAEPQYQQQQQQSHEDVHAHVRPFLSNYQVQHGQNVYEEHQEEVQHQEQPQQQQYIYQQQVQVEEEQQHSQPEPQHHHADVEYQDQYQPQIVYGPPEPVHHQHAHQQEEESDLPSTENFPSPHHTQAIFVKSLKPKPFQPSQPDPTHAPVDYQQVYHSAPEHQESYYQQEQHADYSESAVSITPRSAGAPHNYHAHGETATETPSPSPSKRSTPPFTEEQYRKFGKLISRLKKPKSSSKDE